MSSSTTSCEAQNSTDEARKPPDGELQLVTFQLGAEKFGFDIAQVQEIVRMQPLTRVPNSAKFVQGVINLRGSVIPTLSLRKRLGLEERPSGRETRIIIVETQGSVLGLIVDQVAEVVRLRREMVEAPPRLQNTNQEYVTGVARLGQRLLIVLDINRIVDAGTCHIATQDAKESEGGS
jgi:purine-binding chemotaxis protein CheW